MTPVTLQQGAELAPYHVTARPTDEVFENKIHEDGLARTYGFRGGLVPGVVVYAWMTRPVVEALGREWIERGGFATRFLKPIYYGEPATVRAAVTERRGGDVTIEARALDQAGELCGLATFTLSERPPAPAPDPRDYPAAPLPAERPAVSRQVLATRPVLGSPATLVDRAVGGAFLVKVSDTWPLYAGADAVVHPGYYLDQANKGLSLNVRVSPWVHVESEGQHFGPARVGERFETRVRVKSLYEKKGHEFVELDLLLLADGARPVARVRHVAIYRLRGAA
jgi:acyl dehydratase